MEEVKVGQSRTITKVFLHITKVELTKIFVAILLKVSVLSVLFPGVCTHSDIGADLFCSTGEGCVCNWAAVVLVLLSPWALKA